MAKRRVFKIDTHCRYRLYAEYSWGHYTGNWDVYYEDDGPSRYISTCKTYKSALLQIRKDLKKRVRQAAKEYQKLKDALAEYNTEGKYGD